MTNERITWALVDSEAEALGVKPDARRKWRQRKVPLEWRVKIAERLAGRGVFAALADFDRLVKAGESVA